MQRSPMSPSATTTTSPETGSQGNTVRGFASSLVPLAFVAMIVIVALALAALARQLTAGQGFYTEQWASGIIIVLGLLGSAAAYIVSCMQALRRVKLWQQAGQTALANGALWGLVVVALVVLLPLLLAILIPQQPAPNLAP
jgi:hypothetical protein